MSFSGSVSSSGGTTQQSQSDNFKILIASDIHLGYNERHHIRGDDSFNSFEEVLQAAELHDVDFILLAGDLFHINKPSIVSMNRAIAMIREYCFGDLNDTDPGKIRFKINNFKSANFLDPNLRVKYPIFTIHGNHDDPTGINQTSCIDLLDSSGLVNYFGKRTNVDEVTLKPIILTKGKTKIALYGLGSMHEERLHNIIQNDRFNYMTPSDDLTKYFKIVVVHQNRVQRPCTKYLNPRDLDQLPDLVIWGHEHQCVGQLEYYEPSNFFILQPGSTVATSLSESEAGDKCYSILTVSFDEIKQKPRFKVVHHKCETVRPFLIKTIFADDLVNSSQKRFKCSNELQEFLYNCSRNEVTEMIETSRTESSSSLDQLPLVRLRIMYTDSEHQFDVKKFGRQFEKKVANSEEVVRFVKRQPKSETENKMADPLVEENFDMTEMMALLDDDVVQKEIQIASIMQDYFGNVTQEHHKLGLFVEKYLTGKIVEFVEKENTDVLTDLVDNYKEAIKSIISEQNPTNDDLDGRIATPFDCHDLKEEIREIKNKIESNDGDRLELENKIISRLAKAGKTAPSLRGRNVKKFVTNNDGFSDDDMVDDLDDDNEEDLGNKKVLKAARGGRGSTRASTHVSASPSKSLRPSTSRSVVKYNDDDDDEDDDGDSDFEEVKMKSKKKSPIATARGGRRGRGRPAKSSQIFDDNEDKDDEMDSDIELIEIAPRKRKGAATVAATSTRGRARGRGRAAAASSKTAKSRQTTTYEDDDNFDDGDQDQDDEDQKKNNRTITSFFTKRRRV